MIGWYVILRCPLRPTGIVVEEILANSLAGLMELSVCGEVGDGNR